MRALIKVGTSLLALAVLLIALSYSMLRAQGVSGTGQREGRALVSETRSVGSGIRMIELSGPIDLTMRQGALASMVVKGEQRLLGNVETSQDGATLRIATRGMLLMHRQPLQVVLVLPALEQLSIHGSGESSVNGFSGERIEVALEGSGNVKFNGRYKNVKADLRGSGELEMNGGNSDEVDVEQVGSGDLTVVGATRDFKAVKTGSGELDARHLSAERAKVELQGSGAATVSASAMADLRLRGSGAIAVHGNPPERTIDKTGSGEVTFH